MCNTRFADFSLRLQQCGIVAIPKSTHKELMAQNLDIFDFALTDAEMAQIRKKTLPLQTEKNTSCANTMKLRLLNCPMAKP